MVEGAKKKCKGGGGGYKGAYETNQMQRKSNVLEFTEGLWIQSQVLLLGYGSIVRMISHYQILKQFEYLHRSSD